MNNKTSRRRIRDESNERAVRKLLNSHYQQTQKQAYIQFWFSLIFNALALIVEVGFLLYALTHTRDMTEFGLSLALSINTLAVLIYKRAKETQRRAFELHGRVLSCDLVASLSDEAAQNAALSELIHELVQAETSTGRRRLFDGKPSLNNLVTKVVKNYQAG
jgi:hypothetical protein